MTSHISGVSTRFQNVANLGFIRIWCGAHQLDIVFQYAYRKLSNEAFHAAYDSDLVPSAPTKSCLGDVFEGAEGGRYALRVDGQRKRLFQEKKSQIDSQINEKRPSCTNSHDWWLYLMVVAEFSRSGTTTFKCLQGHHVTASMQRNHLVLMQKSLLHAVCGRDTLSDSEATSLDDSEWVLSECRRFSASISELKQLIMNLGSFVMENLALVPASDVELLFKKVANLYVSSSAGVCDIFDEQNAATVSDKALTPVFPH